MFKLTALSYATFYTGPNERYSRITWPYSSPRFLAVHVNIKIKFVSHSLVEHFFFKYRQENNDSLQN